MLQSLQGFSCRKAVGIFRSAMPVPPMMCTKKSLCRAPGGHENVEETVERINSYTYLLYHVTYLTVFYFIDFTLLCFACLLTYLLILFILCFDTFLTYPLRGYLLTYLLTPGLPDLILDLLICLLTHLLTCLLTDCLTDLLTHSLHARYQGIITKVSILDAKAHIDRVRTSHPADLPKPNFARLPHSSCQTKCKRSHDS